MYSSGKIRPVMIGEVLFDHFQDGTSCPGGGPFNVAWHLRGFGLEPLFISRVGRDSDGEEILDRMQSWGLDTSGVQLDDEFPTGVVDVTLEAGEPTFDIKPRQAYDYIGAAAALAALEHTSPALLYHGTLVTRCSASAAALSALRAATRDVFMDLNLRKPWCTYKRLEPLLRGARWLKVNEAELQELARAQGMEGELDEIAPRLRSRYGAELFLVTRGSEGACIFTADGRLCAPPGDAVPLVDTVGAGDAFSAVALLGLMQNWPEEMILARALEFSAHICRLHGATVDDLAFYTEFTSAWSACRA
jgi:fructokinase